ncbi:MAG: alpha/beta fold hydrolase [Oscillochloris sp.]|nr:alpha/beta fold hydrolase [Oscillochloris sp.]
MEAQVNGILMQYEESGDGPAVLLVHAFPLNGKIWQAQVAALHDRYRVITPDLRGFGDSEAPPGMYTMDQHADDLAALLDHLNLEHVILGGLSMGGYIGFAFLRRHGDRVRALMLCDTKAGPDSIEAQAAREANARLVEEQGSARSRPGSSPAWWRRRQVPNCETS